MKRYHLTKWISWTALILLATAGCSRPVLDYRNADVSDGLIYAGGANEPFTGTVTHVPDSFMLNGEGHAKFMKELGGDKYAIALFLKAVLGNGSPAALCTISVRKGYVDGAATCYKPQSDTQVIEAHFVGGQLSGKLTYYNPEKPDQKLAEGSFEDGQPDGTEKIYSASTGELVAKVNWSRGLYEGGYASYSEMNGKVVLKGAFVQGLRDGTWEQYTKDGKQLVVRAVYRKGLLNGTEEDFDAETGGKTLLVDQWIDGKVTGTRKVWDKNGALVSDETYADGTLIQHQEPSAKSENSLAPTNDASMESATAAVARGLGENEPSAASQSPETPASLDACVNDWTKAHRKAVGEDALISMDQLSEWQDWCRQGKRAPR